MGGFKSDVEKYLMMAEKELRCPDADYELLKSWRDVLIKRKIELSDVEKELAGLREKLSPIGRRSAEERVKRLKRDISDIESQIQELRSELLYRGGWIGKGLENFFDGIEEVKVVIEATSFWLLYMSIEGVKFRKQKI